MGTVTPGSKGSISGTLGGTPVTATLRRDAPDPGAAKPRPPSSIAGLCRLSPRSTCLGGSVELEGGGSAFEVHAREQGLGEVSYDSKTGALTGDVRCTRGGHVLLRALAVDRNLNNVQLLPLDEATPAKPAAGSAPAPAAASGDEAPKPVLTTPSGLGPADERFTATRQNEAFGTLIAAFFIAVAIVMIVARLSGLLAVKLGQPRVMGEVVAGAQRLAREGRVVLHRKHEHACRRRGIEQRRHRIEAVLGAEVHVADQNVRRALGQAGRRRRDVAGLRHDLEVGLHVQQHAQAAAHHRVVVGDDDAQDRLVTLFGHRGRTYRQATIAHRTTCVGPDSHPWSRRSSSRVSYLLTSGRPRTPTPRRPR